MNTRDIERFQTVVNSGCLIPVNVDEIKPKEKHGVLAAFEWTLPNSLNLPANLWWTVQLQFAYILDSFCNISRGLPWSIKYGRSEENETLVELYPLVDHVNSLKHLVEEINDALPDAVKTNSRIVLTYKPRTRDEITLVVASGWRFSMGTKIAAALGFIQIAEERSPDMCIYTAGSYSNYKNFRSLELLSSEMIHIKVNIIEPVLFCDRYEQIIATICPDSLRFRLNQNYIHYQSSGYDSSFHRLAYNSIFKVRISMMNEYGQLISFRTDAGAETLFTLGFEFVKRNLFSCENEIN